MTATTAGLTHDYTEFGKCLRDATFQTVSIITSTGYVSANFDYWPKIAMYMLIFCMFVGGCTGSTSGGFKVLRLIVCAKLASYSLRQFVRPRSVGKLRVGSKVAAVAGSVPLVTSCASRIASLAAMTAS